MLEKTLVAKMKKRLSEEGALVFKTHGGPFQNAGVSDLIGCYRARFFALEVKVPPNKPTKLQERFLDEVVAAGGCADWVDNMRDFELYLSILKQLGRP